MLLSVGPESFIPAAIRPIVDAVPFLLVLCVLPVIADSIGVDINSVTLHVVAAPLAEVLPPILPLVNARALYFIVGPAPLVDGAVCPVVCPKPLLVPPLVFALVRGAL